MIATSVIAYVAMAILSSSLSLGGAGAVRGGPLYRQGSRFDKARGRNRRVDPPPSRD
jgi:hypothetical protein